MMIRSTIETMISEVAAEHGKSVVVLTDDLQLIDSGLDSLCLAVLVARLEDRLGTDPLATTDETTFPVTIGDFIALYENAVV